MREKAGVLEYPMSLIQNIELLFSCVLHLGQINDISKTRLYIQICVRELLQKDIKTIIILFV